MALLLYKLSTSAPTIYSLHSPSPLSLRSGSLWVQEPVVLGWGGGLGGIPPWTSHQFITGLLRDKQPFTFAPRDNLHSAISLMRVSLDCGSEPERVLQKPSETLEELDTERALTERPRRYEMCLFFCISHSTCLLQSDLKDV